MGRVAQLNLTPIVAPPERSLDNEIARELLARVLSGRIPPGSRMPSERQLAEEMGVGRTAVREALTSLSLLGVVEVRRGDGRFVIRSDGDLLTRLLEWGLALGEPRVLDMMEMRQHLEIALAGLAAARRTERDLAEIKRALDRMESLRGDVGPFVSADIDFHLALARSAHNGVMSDLLSNVRALLTVWITKVVRGEVGQGPSFAEHVPIYQAVAVGDIESARIAMKAHMESARARLQTWI